MESTSLNGKSDDYISPVRELNGMWFLLTCGVRPLVARCLIERSFVLCSRDWSHYWQEIFTKRGGERSAKGISMVLQLIYYSIHSPYIGSTSTTNCQSVFTRSCRCCPSIFGSPWFSRRDLCSKTVCSAFWPIASKRTFLIFGTWWDCTGNHQLSFFPVSIPSASVAMSSRPWRPMMGSSTVLVWGSSC